MEVLQKKKRKYLLKGNLFIPYGIEYNWIYVALFILVYSTQASSPFRARWSASNIHLQAAKETKSRVNNLISDHFLVYWQK